MEKGVARDGVRFVNVENPAQPQVLGRYQPSAGQAQAAVVSERFAYVAAGFEGLITLDITDPSAPVKTDHYSGSSINAVDVTLAGRRLLVADQYGPVIIFDLEDPSHPRRTGSLPTIPYPIGVKAVGATAYVALLGSGFDVFDISPASLLRYAGRLAEVTNVLSAAVDGDVTGVVDLNSRFHAINVSDPANLRRYGSVVLPVPGTGHVLISGDVAFVATVSGITTISIAAPDSPQVLTNFPITQQRLAFAIEEDVLYVAAAGQEIPEWGVPAGEGLVILSVTDPGRPQRLSTLKTDGDPYAIAVRGEVGYLANGPGGFLILDVTNATAPRVIARAITSGLATDITLSGQYAYVSTSLGGIQVFDITVAQSPRLVGSFAEGFATRSLMILGDYALVQTGTQTRLYDVSDPENPTYLGSNSSLHYPALAPNPQPSDGIVYLHSIEDGLVAFRLNPAFRSWTRTGAGLHLSWPRLSGTRLQKNANFGNFGWEDVVGSIETNDMTVAIDGGRAFYRLVLP